MADVVIAEWTGSSWSDEPVDLAELEAAIAKSGEPRASVSLRLTLNADGVYEEGDWPSPVLQLVRPETDAERTVRQAHEEEIERARISRLAVWDASFVQSYFATMGVPAVR